MMHTNISSYSSASAMSQNQDAYHSSASLDGAVDRKLFADIKQSLRYTNDLSELDIYTVLQDLTPQFDANYPSQSVDSLVSLIKESYGVDGQITIGKGVKDLWSKTCEELFDKGYQIILPKDVYPRYFDVPNKNNYPLQTYETLTGLDLPKNAPSKSVMVVTSPHTYHASSLTAHEVSSLKEWLSDSPDRRIFIDAVYNYDQHIGTDAKELLETNQVYFCSSLSKTHLCPKVMGFVVDSPNDLTVESEIDRKLPATPLKF